MKTTIEFLKSRLIFEENPADIKGEQWTAVYYKAYTKAIPEEKDFKNVMLCAGTYKDENEMMEHVLARLINEVQSLSQDLSYLIDENDIINKKSGKKLFN